MADRPFWKQPQGMILIGGGGIVLLATLWLVATSLGPAPAVVDGPAPAPRIDDNALIAANAESANQAAAPAPVVTASADKPPAEAPVTPPAPVEPERFNPNEIIAEAQESLDAAREEIEGMKPPVDEEGEGGKEPNLG